MCGIVGYVGKKSVVPVIIEGLRKLEYRGYDSAGIAVSGKPLAQLRRDASIGQSRGEAVSEGMKR